MKLFLHGGNGWNARDHPSIGARIAISNTWVSGNHQQQVEKGRPYE